MSKTKKETMIKKLDYLIENDKDYSFAIVVTTPGSASPEIIINSKNSLKQKREYWSKTYDDNLIHHNNVEIKIIAFDQMTEDTFTSMLNKLSRYFRSEI